MKRKNLVSKEVLEFFKAEIRNEESGGVSPATIGSALDSLWQAPADVVAQWAKVFPAVDKSPETEIEWKIATLVQSEVEKEVQRLARKYGKNWKLASFIPFP